MQYLPVYIALALYLSRIFEFLLKRQTTKGSIKERLSFTFLFLAGTVVTFSAVIEYVMLDRSPSYLLTVIGTATFLGAMAFRRWAIRTLGTFWSVHVEIREQHELITSGPFKRIRHPVYTAAILEVVGAVLILQAIGSALLILITVLPAIIYRIRIEEQELIQKFGAPYRDYMSRTGSLFPKLL